MLPPIEHEYFTRLYGQVVRTGNPISFETYSSFLGRYFTINAFKTTDNRFATVFFDITDRKKTEEELKIKTEELERYFTSSLDLLCIADIQGHFIRLNPEWEKSLGYSVKELEGQLFLNYVHPDDMDRTLAAIQKLSSQSAVLSFENRYRCKDGSYRWIEWRSRPDGEIIYAVARDVTNEKMIEKLCGKVNLISDLFLNQ